MGIHSVKPGQTTVGNVSQPAAPAAKKTPVRTAGTGSAPTLKARSAPRAQAPSATSTTLITHSEPRISIRVDTDSVRHALGSSAARIDGIDPQRLPGFYKHASMIVNDNASDKSFLLECLTNLYLSAPDSSHPHAVDPGWLDDQDVLWGDELLFLFEVAPQLDRLGAEGKRYFADSLADRGNIDRQMSGSVDALEQILRKASQRMALTG